MRTMTMHAWLVAIVFFCVAWRNKLSNAQLHASILPPLNYVAYYNQPVHPDGTFTCLLKENHDMRWIIDGTAHDRLYIRESRNITVNQTEQNTSRIYIPAITANSDIALIKCRAYILQPFRYSDSNETAHFSVQGLLQIMLPIMTAGHNSTHNIITWEEPFTLNITDVEPDIIGYTVCININTNLLDDCKCTNVTETEFVLPKYFYDINVSITAWNIVGESPAVVYGIDKCTEIVEEGAMKADVGVSFEANLTTLLFTFFRNHTEGEPSVIPMCLYSYHVVVYHRHSNTSVTETTLYGYHDSIKVHLKLQSNIEFTARVKRATATSNLSFEKIYFSTFDIQKVSITGDEDSILVVLHIASGTDSQGLVVAIQTNGDGIVLSRNVSLNQCQEGISNTSELCLLEVSFQKQELLLFGEYTILVYNWEKDDNLIQVFSKQQSSSTTTTTEMVSTDVRGTESNSLILTGAISGGGLMAIILLTGIVVICVAVGLFRKSKRGSEHNIAEPDIQQNEAYSVMLRMDKNKAYEAVKSLRNNPRQNLGQEQDEQPHVYEEIELNRPEETNVYEEVSSAVRSQIPTEVVDTQQNTGYTNLLFNRST